MELKRTPLEREHLSLGAKMGEFAGWSMPIEYEGTLKEHRAVREDVGIFDLTHLGKIDVQGEGAGGWLQRVLSNDLEKVGVGGAQYNLVLTEDGGIVDDVIAYRLAERDWLVVPNAANTSAVLEALRAETRADVVVNHRPDLTTIAVQGPRSIDLVTPLVPEVSSLASMACTTGTYREAAFPVARSGYTGEKGVELFAPEGIAPALWRDLVEAGAVPVGLAARDTLRLEMGYALHGNDIGPDRDPVEAMLTWACALDTDFVGRDAVAKAKEAGPARRLRGLRMRDRRIPRPHQDVYRGEERVGETTSGTFSPTLKIGIAMAYLDADITPGDTVGVDVRGKRGEAEVVKPPFVDASPK